MSRNCFTIIVLLRESLFGFSPIVFRIFFCSLLLLTFYFSIPPTLNPWRIVNKILSMCNSHIFLTNVSHISNVNGLHLSIKLFLQFFLENKTQVESVYLKWCWMIKNKEIDKDMSVNWNNKKAIAVILLSEKVKFKPHSIKHDKEVLFLILKARVHYENITILKNLCRK